MSKKKSDKKNSCLEAKFEDVLVCKKNNLKPYMEIFIQQPENISQQNLGTIAGVLEITDEAEESSYVVNYLISVIKKEYFQKAKRGSVESFEAALHRANLALSKLAEHENLGWLGKINAIILVIEKNNLHLAQTGNARALLLRGKSLTDISEGSSTEISPNPLKTFVDVLSGRLEKDDKLIITTQHIFDIFSFEEIKKSALRFSFPEFTQFLKTALGNELEKAAVLAIEINDEEKIEEAPLPAQKSESLNAFSQATFAKSQSKKTTWRKTAEKSLNAEEKTKITAEIKEQLAKNNGDFIDSKTGHIYIKEDHFLKKDSSPWNDFIKNTRQKISATSNPLKKALPAVRKSTAKFRQINFLAYLKIFFLASLSFLALATKFIWGKIKIFSVWLFEKTRVLIQKFREKRALRSSTKNIPSQKPASVFSLELLLPKFSRIKNIFLNLNSKQKIYALSAIILLLVVPYIIVKIQDEPVKETSVNAPAPIVIPLENDKNVIRLENLTPIRSGKETADLVNLNDSIFALSGNEIVDIKNNITYPLPEDFSIVKKFISMDDLTLLFLLSADNKILSFSPVSKKFQAAEIAIPAGADIVCAQTYLTYLYLLDKKNNQIYRYPRAGNGFGEKTDWLKDSVSLDKIKDMAISENIFLAQSDELLKFYRNKKQDFTLENSTTPIEIEKIYTSPNSQNIYLLDKNNSRIIKLDLEGRIISQYYNVEVGNANAFTVDEKNALIYFSHGSEISSFEMK